MKVLKFGSSEQSIFEVLAIVLHLGNVKFTKKADVGFSGDGVDIANPDSANFIAELVGADPATFRQQLIERSMTQRGETFYTPLNEIQVCFLSLIARCRPHSQGFLSFFFFFL